MDAPSHWWQDFFSGLVVEFWGVAVPAEATRDDVEFLWKHLRLRAGARVLDVPCGDGRLTLPLAARGCAMTGVDLSQEFLDAARRGAREQGVSMSLRRSDMRRLPSRASYDAAFCFGNSFGYLDDAGNEAFLAAVARTLSPGGRFAIDYGQSAESIFSRLEPRLEAEMGGIGFFEETRYDVRSGRIENRYTLTRGGRSEVKLASQRVYMVREIERILGESGLEILEIFGSPREEPFALGSPRLLIVAERKSAGRPSKARRR